MSKPEVIKIDEVEYIRKDSVPKTTGDIRIVILQRGWIVVGRYTQDGSNCKLTNASVIRIWGTTKGLPELVHGPTSSTKLDKCEGIVEFDWLTVIHTITVNKEKWNL